mmetsp:Transcript_106886/g.166979  ORF Transcript_106886/g.166979 Transcript_106886/m.166979 type:complete len:213 (+) Transcript_106886:22-660(+)
MDLNEHASENREPSLASEDGQRQRSTESKHSTESKEVQTLTIRCNQEDLDHVYSQDSLRNIAEDLAANYKTEFCLISLAGSDGNIDRAARFSNGDSSTPWKAVELRDTRLLKVLVKRGVPTIIDDVQAHASLQHDPLVLESGPGKGVGCDIRFFVELPLRVNNFYFGTICLIDDKPRKEFDLGDAESLMEKARKLINTISELCYFDRPVNGT